MNDITFPTSANGVADRLKGAYFAGAGASCGGVIVIQEIFGLSPHIRGMAERLSRAGFNALAPDYFTRSGAAPTDMQGGMAVASMIPDAQALSDTAAAIAYLKARPNANGKIALIGFCWGGRLVMLANAKLEGIDAAIAYYGMLTGEATAMRPQSPRELVPEMKAPLLGHFGGEDDHIKRDDVEKFAVALKAAGRTNEIHLYAEAGHAFANETRPEAYRAEAAELAFTRSLAWLSRYLA